MDDRHGPRGATAAERIVVVDALRGFALAGILLANSLYWSGWDFMPEAQAIARFGREETLRLGFWHKFLIDGKFYTIFSLLFGLGFALQLARLEARGADGLRILRRRLLVLLGIGLVHLVLVWDGDILTLYALLGFVLPWFRRLSGRALLLWAAGCLLLPLATAPLFRAVGWAPWNVVFPLAAAINREMADPSADLIGLLQRPDWASFFGWKSVGWLFRIWNILDWWRIPKVLGAMLLGMWAGRRLVGGTLLSDRRLLLAVLAGGLLIGLPGSWLYATTPGAGQNSWGSMIGTAPLGLAYAAGFVLLWNRASPLLLVLAPGGRMALTNYLAQSVLGTAIYLGIGFGLVGRAPPATVYGIAAAIFAVQLAWSHLWLARFDQGPMEWLWRRLTYAAARRA